MLYSSRCLQAVVIFPSLVPAKLQSVCSPRASVRDGSLPLQLGLGDSNPASQADITPHPNVELKMGVPQPIY